MNLEFSMAASKLGRSFFVGQAKFRLHLLNAAPAGPEVLPCERYRIFPVCPSEYRPGCGQTVSPCGIPPTGMVFTAPSLVLKA